MDWKKAVIALYALGDLIAGVQGYAAGAKIPWLVWNVGFAVGIGISLALSSRRPSAGYVLCLLFAAADGLFYAHKLVVTKLIWPAAVVLILAVAALVCIISEMFSLRKRPA